MEGWDVVRALDVDVSVYRGISNDYDVIVVSVVFIGRWAHFHWIVV